MGEDSIAIFICVTPSYDHWLLEKANAISTARSQTYNPHDVKVLKFDDGTDVYVMFSKCLAIALDEGYSFFTIIGADDWIAPTYVEECIKALKYPNQVAASSWSWLCSREGEVIGTDERWVAGVWRTSACWALGGFLKPQGRKWGCAADLWVRARKLGLGLPVVENRLYYWRIYTGSVSKTDKEIDARIAARRKGEMFRLGGVPRE